VEEQFLSALNVPGVNDVRKTEIHTAEPSVPEPSASDVEMTIKEVKRNQSPGTDQIPAGMIKAGSRTIRSEIHELINSIWNKEELPEEWKELIIVPLYMKGNKTDCSNYRGISFLSDMHNILQMQRKLLGIINVNFNTTGQLLIISFAFVKYLRKKWENNEAVHQLFLDFKQVYDSVMREVLYNILNESGIPMKLVRLIKMYLN